MFPICHIVRTLGLDTFSSQQTANRQFGEIILVQVKKIFVIVAVVLDSNIISNRIEN